MNNFTEVVRKELIDSGALTSLVGTKIYSSLAPQDTVPPFVVLTLISNVPQHAMGVILAEDLLENGRVQVDAYASTYAKAYEVAAAVDGVLANLGRADISVIRETLGSTYDDSSALHKVTADYSVWL